MNAQQAKEYAAKHGFVISKTEDGKFRVVYTKSGANAVRSRYDGIGVFMKEIVDTLTLDARIAAVNEPEDNTPLLTKSANEVRAANEQRLNQILATHNLVPVIDESSYRFLLRVTFKKHDLPWGSGFVLYFRSRQDAVNAARKVLSGKGGKNIEDAVIVPV